MSQPLPPEDSWSVGPGCRSGADPAGNVSARLRSLARCGKLDLPLPAAGQTWDRWRRLAMLTSSDVCLGRLAEGHADAVAILAEAEGTSLPGAVLGVWAAEGPGSTIEAEPRGARIRLSGRRAYCSGAHSLTHALLAVRLAERRRLVLVELDTPGLAWEEDSWPATGMAASDSPSMTLHEVEIDGGALVGPEDFYTERPGFWLGAMGVAACWWGGACGVARDAREALLRRAPDPHRLGHLGAMSATLRATGALLREAAAACDGGLDTPALRQLALTVRAQAAAAGGVVLDHARPALGSDPLCHDDGVGRRVADLYVYLSQFREGAELADLGAACRDDGTWP